MINSIVIGMGEVGTALFEIISKNYSCEGLDKGDWVEDTCKYLNICIPYSKSFVEVVNDYITRYSPKLTIIHSSVPVGTTKLVNGMVVHSPVRGKHPDIKNGLLDYVKFVGYNDGESADLAKEYLSRFFKVEMVDNSDVTELMKIASLAKYGVYLEMAREIDGYFNQIGSSYEYMKRWDETQNEYIGKYYPSMQMPIIEPPKGELGGHCVLPVTEMLLEDKRFNASLPFVAYSKNKSLSVVQHLRVGEIRCA